MRSSLTASMSVPSGLKEWPSASGYALKLRPDKTPWQGALFKRSSPKMMFWTLRMMKDTDTIFPNLMALKPGS